MFGKTITGTITFSTLSSARAYQCGTPPPHPPPPPPPPPPRFAQHFLPRLHPPLLFPSYHALPQPASRSLQVLLDLQVPPTGRCHTSGVRSASARLTVGCIACLAPTT
ncbi:unnamed protein product [Closterium sp. NIES-54]